MCEENAGLLWIRPSSHGSKGEETVSLLRVDGSSNGSVLSASETADLLWVGVLFGCSYGSTGEQTFGLVSVGASSGSSGGSTAPQ